MVTSAPEPPGPGVAARPAARVDVVLEAGARWVFASALDWPGWCRRGVGEEGAIEALLGHRDRYGDLLAAAGLEPPAGAPVVVERVAGGSTTDFGAPSAVAAAEAALVGGEAGARLAAVLDACWAGLDQVVATAPAQLRLGPRGGGRDRDEVARHVQEAERSYARKIGVRLPPHTPWAEQRAALLAAIRAGGPDDPAWPLRYLVRRTAWHVTDHAWEIVDRSS